MSDFIWYELMTTDSAAAQTFYGTVFGWSAKGGQDGYAFFGTDDAMIGGMLTIPVEAAEKGMRPMWLSYLHVPDVDSAIAAMKAEGARVHWEPHDVPNAGRIAMITDPQDAMVYLMTPSGEGVSRSFEMGTEGHVTWNELITRDLEAGWDFYSRHFGWDVVENMDMGPMGVYRMFGKGTDPVGGMMAMLPETPVPMWLPYVQVSDVDATKAAAETAGATIVHGPSEVPGGDWIVQAIDPQGALFAFVGKRAA